MDTLFGAKEGEVLSVFAALVSVALLPAAGTVGHHRAERTAVQWRPERFVCVFTDGPKPCK